MEWCIQDAVDLHHSRCQIGAIGFHARSPSCCPGATLLLKGYRLPALMCEFTVLFWLRVVPILHSLWVRASFPAPGQEPWGKAPLPCDSECEVGAGIYLINDLNHRVPNMAQ